MSKSRRPFWLPASNYYVLAVGVALVFFFTAWGLLDDAEAHAPWQTAGVGASILLIGAVILREIIMSRSRATARRPVAAPRASDRHKLTVERSAAILADLRRKSDAANILGRIASGHREVFETCAVFIQRIENELPSVQPDSPRLAALLRSRSLATDIHRFHLLRWAELEATTLSTDARSLPDPDGRIRAARTAVAVVDEALVAYPNEESLLGSRALLTELTVSIEVANLVVAAEQAAVRGEIGIARKLYRDALFSLGGDNIQSADREHAAMKVREALERLSFSDHNR